MNQRGSVKGRILFAAAIAAVVTSFVLSGKMRNVAPRREGPVKEDGPAQKSERQPKDDASDRDRVLQYINHINWVVYKINSYNDPIVLEEEYRGLDPNSLRFDSIDDPETINIIKQILDLLVQMRINEKEREFIEQDREDEMANLLAESLPNPASCISVNPWVAATKVAGAVFQSYQNYERGKKKVMKKFERANWELEKNQLFKLNDLNKNLLENQWKLVKRYGIDDRKRVVEEDFKELMTKLKDTNEQRKYGYLVEHEMTFEKLPLYWYYRASAANKIGDFQGAIAAADRYQRIHLQILRKDKFAALVAILKIDSMIKIKKLVTNDIKIQLDENEVARQLDIIEGNVGLNDWNMLYFAACMRSSVCNDDERAQRKLADLVAHLEFKSESRLAEWRGLLGSRNAREKERKSVKKQKESLEGKIAKLKRKSQYPGAEDYKQLKELEEKCHDLEIQDLRSEGRPDSAALYACRTALLKIRSKTLKPEEVERKAMEIFKMQDTSANEKLFLYGLVRTKDIAERVKAEFEKVKIKLATLWGREDCVSVQMPYSWYLIPTKFEIVFLNDFSGDLCEAAVISESDTGRTIARDDNDITLVFRQEFDKLPKSVTHVMLRFANDNNTFKAIYRIPKKHIADEVKGCVPAIEKLMVDDAEVDL